MVKHTGIPRLHAMRVSIRSIAFSCRCSSATVRTVVVWQHLFGHFRQRLRPASLNSTGLMYPSLEWSLTLLYHQT